jgi:uncharacterized damage-inducible protein DinB
MLPREFYLERRRAELPAFLRILNALPADQLHYKPHERSPSAEQIVWTMTKELGACADVATTYKTEAILDPAPPLAEMLALFEQWAHAITDRVATLTDEEWQHPVQLYYKGKLMSEQPLAQWLWFIHFDAIHHRGQLSAYIRPMGGIVPSVYGPSADARPA